MQIETKELEYCKYRVNYSSSSEEISEKKLEILKAFKKAPIPGFRPGKASNDAIMFHYKEQINESLKRALAEDAFHNTLFDKGFKPFGAPKFGSVLLIDGKFTCNFDLYVKPNFELASYKDLELPKPHTTETATSLSEKMLQELRSRLGETNPYAESDFVQEGDNIIVTYDAFVDGEKVQSLSAEGDMICVGKSGFKSFDENLLGMHLNETREFTVSAPDDVLPSFAGKTVNFKVTVSMGSKNVPCPLDDTLGERLGYKTFSELRQEVMLKAQAQIASNTKLQHNEAVANKLVSINNFDIPSWMKLQEAQYLASNAKLDWQQMPDVDKEQYISIAEKNVKLALILDKIRDNEPDTQLSDEEAFNIIKQNLSHRKIEKSLDEVLQEMNKTGYLQFLFSKIRDENTLDFICKQTRFVD